LRRVMQAGTVEQRENQLNRWGRTTDRKVGAVEEEYSRYRPVGGPDLLSEPYRPVIGYSAGMWGRDVRYEGTWTIRWSSSPGGILG
jgi:hypothetical protein